MEGSGFEIEFCSLGRYATFSLLHSLLVKKASNTPTYEVEQIGTGSTQLKNSRGFCHSGFCRVRSVVLLMFGMYGGVPWVQFFSENRAFVGQWLEGCFGNPKGPPEICYVGIACDLEVPARIL